MSFIYTGTCKIIIIIVVIFIQDYLIQWFYLKNVLLNFNFQMLQQRDKGGWMRVLFRCNLELLQFKFINLLYCDKYRLRHHNLPLYSSDSSTFALPVFRSCLNSRTFVQVHFNVLWNKLERRLMLYPQEKFN